ncbi:hypothetical protein CRYUN_Cryun04dG0016800 [Craigia yunnanensis]
MAFKSFLKFWSSTFKRKFLRTPSSSGVCNHQGIFMVASGIKMAVFDRPLEEDQDLIIMPGRLDLWFDPSNNGVNKEARRLNHLIKEALQGTDIQLLDLTHLSEFRADAHPAIWLGKRDAVSIWGQDCMHWCLPGVPDTRVDILVQLIQSSFETG